MLAKIINNTVVEYPYNLAQLQQDYPNTSFPSNFEYDTASMAGFNVYHVYIQERPSSNAAVERVEEGTPRKVGGVWIQSWNKIQLSAEEQSAATATKAAEIRAERTSLLTACDWTQLRDVNASVSAQWAPYREQLRNIPQQPGFPWNVVWPTPPSV